MGIRQMIRFFTGADLESGVMQNTVTGLLDDGWKIDFVTPQNVAQGSSGSGLSVRGGMLFVFIKESRV